MNKKIISAVMCLLLAAPCVSWADPGESVRERLAHECARDMQDSCYALREYNAVNPPAYQEGNQSTRDRYFDECRRGFQASCNALRGLSGLGPAPPREGGYAYPSSQPLARSPVRTVCGVAPSGMSYCYTTQ